MVTSQWFVPGTRGLSIMNVTNPLKDGTAEIRVAGKTLYVPAVEICDRTVVVTGTWLRRAAVKDEHLVEGEIVERPQLFLEQLRSSGLRADILSFCQKIPETTPRYEFHLEWDNWAVVPITSYNAWWEKVPQETRKNVRRSAKRGVVVRPVTFSDEFVSGILGLYNETPIRQGRRFWHFGKDFETVKRESSTYLDRSEFIGAYFDDELIGFIKIVYVDRMATLMHILSKNAHQDKRPINAMLAKAVEVCVKREISFLIYGQYTYDGNENSPLTEFKRRNGFVSVKYPRYFIPLTTKGNVALQLGIHKGLKPLIPRPAADLFRRGRSWFYQRQHSETGALAINNNSPQARAV
jgi:hypothetical protein